MINCEEDGFTVDEMRAILDNQPAPPSMYDLMLEFAPIINETQLPESIPLVAFMPGVYVLYKNHVPIYVGMSMVPFERILAHKRVNIINPPAKASCDMKKTPFVDFDDIKIFTCGKKELISFETAMIRMLKPAMNMKFLRGGPEPDEYYLKKYAGCLYRQCAEWMQ